MGILNTMIKIFLFLNDCSVFKIRHLYSLGYHKNNSNSYSSENEESGVRVSLSPTLVIDSENRSKDVSSLCLVYNDSNCVFEIDNKNGSNENESNKNTLKCRFGK